MKRIINVYAMAVAAWMGMSFTQPLQADDRGKAFGDAHYVAYEGAQQHWPTGKAAQVINDYAVPIYLALPDKRYKVLGRIYDPRKSGIGLIGRAFAEGLFPEKDRQRDCANQAKYRGADAVLVTDDEKIVKAFGLDLEEIRSSAPLFNHKSKLVLAVKLGS